MRKFQGCIIAFAAWAMISAVQAADNNFPTPGGATAPLVVQGCLDAGGHAVPQNQSSACPGGGGGGGTQNVNLTQILGAAPSLTNPLWVFPATGATFPVSGTFWPYSLGQQLPANSVPVVLTAAQLATLTPPTSLAAATPIACASLCANLVIKNAAGTLFSFEVSADSTLSGAAWWLMIYNATSAPADGAVTPAKCYALPSGATGFNGAFDTGGVAFGTGIVVGVSTTGCFTKTASTHAFISGDFQ